MVLGFKKQFIEPIIAGTKIHTIREDKTDRWQVGKTIHMATGVRTSNYGCFQQEICTNVQDIFMSIEQGSLHISIDSQELYYYPEKEILAKNDGFENWGKFVDWFYPLVEKNGGEFGGVLIHWTDFSYGK